MFRRLVLSALSRMPAPTVERWVVSLIKATALRVEPASALRFLLEIEANLYPLQGRLAVAYGEGEHVKHRLTSYHDFFVNRVAKGQRVLDIGCGEGDLAYDVVTRAGAIVFGIDSNEASIEAARRRHVHPNLTLQRCNATEELPPGPFDVVILSNVLEHMPLRSALLLSVVKMTNARCLLLRVPLFERDWRVPLKQELGIEWKLDPTHEIEYTAESFAAEMVAAGLVIEEQQVRWGEIWAVCSPANPVLSTAK